ncbi:MAG: hypothetical protein WBI14_05105 [Anaerolineaceae bacterium]
MVTGLMEISTDHDPIEDCVFMSGTAKWREGLELEVTLTGLAKGDIDCQNQEKWWTAARQGVVIPVVIVPTPT